MTRTRGGFHRAVEMPTGRLLRKALLDLTLLLQVDMPALRLSRLVLERETEDGATLLNRVLAVLLAARERVVDGVEGARRGELVCCAAVSLTLLYP